MAATTLGGGLTLGANNIVTAVATIASTELDRLDGKDAALVDVNDAVGTAITSTSAAMFTITGDLTVSGDDLFMGTNTAGFALIVAASLFLRSRAEQRQMAYDSVLGPANGGPTLAIRDAQTERQATINYINGR